MQLLNDGTLAAPIAALKDNVLDQGFESEEEEAAQLPWHIIGQGGPKPCRPTSMDLLEDAAVAAARKNSSHPQDFTRKNLRKRGASRGSKRFVRLDNERGGGIFKQAAIEILRQEMRLMSTGEIARFALRRGLVKCTGKTPEATMASALYTDIKRREECSVFIRPHEGLFGLREWVKPVADGVTPQLCAASAAAAVPQRRTVSGVDEGDTPADVSVGSGNDGLMELLEAAEELRRSGSEDEYDVYAKCTAAAEPHAVQPSMLMNVEEYIVREPAQTGHSLPPPIQTEAPKYCPLALHAAAPANTTAPLSPPMTVPKTAPVESPQVDVSVQSVQAIKCTEIVEGGQNLRKAEEHVVDLEKVLGSSHPEVGKSYLSLARLYLEDAEMPDHNRLLADAALSRAHEIMSVCQHSIRRAEGPLCGLSFAVLLQQVGTLGAKDY